MGEYKPYYDNQRAWLRVSGFQTTGTAIQNPFTFYYTQNNDWSSSHSYQFWNKNFTTAVGVNNEETLKTIYSPSPSGFVEPKTAAFTGFTFTGGEAYNVSQFNAYEGYDKGWNFCTKGWKVGSTIFFQSLGFRDVYANASGYLAGVNDGGVFWASGASSTSNGTYLSFTNTAIQVPSVGARSYGISARSVKDD